jgi:hypothetical protein
MIDNYPFRREDVGPLFNKTGQPRLAPDKRVKANVTDTNDLADIMSGDVKRCTKIITTGQILRR